MKHVNRAHKQVLPVAKILAALGLTALVILVLTLTQPKKTPEGVLASRTISLEKRWNNKFVNDVFKDNILLNLAYLQGTVASNKAVNWNNVEKAQNYEFTLEPGKTFSFHEDVLPQYKNTVVKTTNAHFNSSEGFKSDGYLVGDGVCHLASILYWAAKDANLDAVAPTNHNFMAINQVPKEYGVAIYSGSGAQNLYITNNKNVPVTFKIKYDGADLNVRVVEPVQAQPNALALGLK